MKITPVTLFQNINSWQDFEVKLQAFSKKDKGDAFEWLVKFYFQIDPTLRSKYQHVWLLGEIPVTERKHINIHAEDLGIDLIAKTEDEYHAIQCKFHSDKTKAVTYKEVSTYLAQLESNPKITQGYICAFADGTSRQYQKHNAKPVNQILSDSWSRLDTDFFNNVRDLIEGKKPQYNLYKPKEHQRKAIEEAKEYFLKQDQRRGKLIFPCGAGKSLTGFWMMQALHARSALIAVPSLSLVKQTLDIYLKQITAQNGHVKWLCICSDEGIGKNEDVVYFTENLGIPCNTDPIEIEQWLLKHRGEPIIVFTTYQSSPIIASISKKMDYTFEVAILDEAHKTVGHKEKLFSHLLFDENIRIQRRIFMTATERFFSGPKDNILSMDDPEVYGETFAFMSFKEAIRLDLLTDYRLITIDIKKSEIASFIRENNLVQLNEKWKKEAESRSLASMLALRKAMKQLPIKNAVSFHGSIEKARRSQELQEFITSTYHYDPIQTFTVSGQIPTTQRNEIVQEFARSPRSLITNAKCLTEGVDVPNIDCIVFADPRSSKVDIVQALGRALRKKEGKEWGYVIVPVIYDDETGEIDNESFGEIMNIVQGLASNDERIVEYFRDKNRLDRQLSGGGEEKFHLDILSDYLDAEELARNLEIRLWEKLARLNWMEFEKAREYVRGLKLQTRNEWKEYCRSNQKPLNIPINPQQVYKNEGWTNWGNWLGTGYIHNRERKFKNFYEAKKYAQGLHLSASKDWKKFVKTKLLPVDIPANPSQTYKNEGWISWGDWLGTGFVSYNNRIHKSYTEAREYVHKLNIQSISKWTAYCKSGSKPLDIPSVPAKFYKDKGWISWGDWLGTNTIAFKHLTYLSFSDARAFVHKLELKNSDEWKSYCKSGLKPSDIPNDPASKYKNEGWKSMGDWLGTGYIAPQLRTYLPFEEAKEIVRKMNLSRLREWKEICLLENKPNNIPSNPDQFYKNKGWISWADWFGSDYIAPRLRVFRSFEKAREYARSLQIKSSSEWKKRFSSGKIPADIPGSPSGAYKGKGWVSWGDWLGTSSIGPGQRNYKPFHEAKSYAQSLTLHSRKEWNQAFNEGMIPVDIPVAADRYYKDLGWVSWGDWLGTNIVSKRLIQYRDFYEAREFVRKLKFNTQAEWMEYCRSGNKPEDIPSDIYKVYKNKGFISMGDWLGTGTIASQRKIHRPFEEARAFAQNLKINSKNEWAEFSKSGNKPDDIPADPARVYQDKGWISWGDWLGNHEIVRPRKVYRDFYEARNFVRKLKLKDHQEWVKYCQSGQKPADIPTSVYQIYKNEGWTSMGDWLGTDAVSSQLRTYRDFYAARDYVRSLHLNSLKEWKEYCKSGKKPSDIPTNVQQTYQNKGWVSMNDWLGHGFIPHRYRMYRPFEEARAFARTLKLTSIEKWKKYCNSGNKPEDIPNYPNEKYATEGWISWGDWLGTGDKNAKNKDFLNFNEARKIAHDLLFNSKTEWAAYSKSGLKPDNIPADPSRYYRDNGWISWGDWLGKE